MADDDWQDWFCSWSHPGSVAHPNSPAGGSGTGHSRPPAGAHGSPWPSQIPHVDSPAGRHFHWGNWLFDDLWTTMSDSEGSTGFQMGRVSPEPVYPAALEQSHGLHRIHGARNLSLPNQPPSGNVDALVARVQHEFPNAHIRITGRGRTVQRQAELMAQRRRGNRAQFLRTYLPARHITEMDSWVTDHPNANQTETAEAFAGIINRARQNGAVVSNHLSDRARDVSIPVGGHTTRNRVRQRMRQLGAHVIDEHDAVGGPHWHVDF